MSRRNTRRDGPTTMRTVGAYDIGAPPPKSARQMQAEIDERTAAKELRLLVEQNPDLGHRVHMMIKAEVPAVDILAALDPTHSNSR